MIDDTDDYNADIAYLITLGNVIYEIVGGHPYYASGSTVEQQLIDDLSSSAREAVFGEWPTKSVGMAPR